MVAELCAEAPEPLPFAAARREACLTASVSFGLAFITVSSMT